MSHFSGNQWFGKNSGPFYFNQQSHMTNAQIAQMLFSPTQINTMFVFGSSRCSSYGFERAMMSACSAIPWSGMQTVGTLAAYSANGHTSAVAVKSTGSVDSTPSITIPGVELAFGSSHMELSYTGVPHDSLTVTLRRGSTGYFASLYFPLLWSRLQGYGATINYNYWKHSAGVSVESNGPRPLFLNHQKVAPTSFGLPNYSGLSINDTTGTGYGSVQIIVPNSEVWNGTSFDLCLSHELNANIPNGQILASDGPTFVLDRPGTVLINWSQGGGTMARWTKTTIFNDSVFDTLVNLKGPNPILLLEVAEFLSLFPNQATQQAQIQAVINRFRSGGRDYAPVIVHSGYPTSTSGATWCEWLEESCATIPGVMYIDTHSALPNYTDGVALGYYDPRAVPTEPYQTDTVHYGPTYGIPAFASMIESLISAYV
jgi:hypothetical protein